MPAVPLRAPHGVPEPIRAGVERLRDDLGIGAFPADALAEAERASSLAVAPGRDATHLPLLTLDPEGSMDLDQALLIERDGDGYRVWYAIADVAAFVVPDGALDREAHRRGLTYYAPDRRTPLHPMVLSEGAASLLPGVDRPALLWEHSLDAAGEVTASTVARALVRSRERWSYVGAQAALADGSAPEVLALLAEVGRKREERERLRGGISLPIPDQEVEVVGGAWELRFRSPLEVEGWNAQISLLTGMAAARMMLDAGVGILRTLPPARQADVERLRRAAKGLHIEWPGPMPYADFVRSLDPRDPRHLAMLNACTTLFRGAGYVAFDGEPPAQPLHAALATPYAHCTAPLRRLVDRYVGEFCVALSAGDPVPEGLRAALPGLPGTMASAMSRSNTYERGLLDLVEALVLHPHVGERFEATVVEWDAEAGRGAVQLAEPAVAAPLVGGEHELGSEVRVRLAEADVGSGRVEFRS